MSSLNFVFRIQPADVVLSVIDSAQSPFDKRSASISIQGLVIDAMNLSKLFDAVKQKLGCSLYLQANPLSSPTKPVLVKVMIVEENFRGFLVDRPALQMVTVT